VIADVLIIAELAYSIYRGSLNPEYIASVFLKTYIPAVLVTLLIFRVLLRKLASEE